MVFPGFFYAPYCLGEIRFQKIIDGTTQRFYVNGQEVGNPLDGQGFSPNDVNPLRIGGGATEGNGNFFFHGDIDEAAVYDTALSPERVLAHYEAGINPIPEPSTIVLSVLGIFGLLATARRRRKIARCCKN